MDASESGAVPIRDWIRFVFEIIRGQEGNKRNMEKLLNELTERKDGLVFLSAPTNGGKTTLLRALQEKRGDVKTMSAEAFCEAVIQPIKEMGNQSLMDALEGYGCICVEDLDWHRGKEYTQYEFANRLKALSQKALVIVTGVELKARLPHLFAKLQTYTYYKKDEAETAWIKD